MSIDGVSVGPLLEVQDVHARYGPIRALSGIDLRVHPGEIVALVGANGAGKSTLLSTISGLVPVESGAITLAGSRVEAEPTRVRLAAGLAHVPEGRRLFSAMTVEQNLLLGAYTRRDGEVTDDLEAVLEVFPRLRLRLRALAGTLSGGEQQMVAIGRGLMSRPTLMMVDELSLGLAPTAVDTLIDALRKVNADGMSLLIVEQDVQTALELADRGVVLELGTVAVTGTGAELLADERVRQAYLGV